MRLDRPDIDLCKLSIEEFTVLCVHYRLNRSSKYLYIVFIKDAGLIQIHTAVQGCLSAECEENTLRSFFLNYLFHKVRSDGEEVYFVSNLL